ncbi:MAG: adenylate/guanylate cyclase domain-containing protein [Sulfuritalea sp.]|nr:adenylate/guanylate cyclase domain-containing protein [Sulfuritalea sp.]
MPVPPSTHAHNPQDDSEALRDRLTTTTEAYGRFVPRQFLNLLGIEDIRKVEVGQQVERKMTVLFADIRNFTSLSESMSPQENFNFLNSYLIQMEPIITAHGGFIDKYIGDAIMALFPDSPDAALRCSLAMLKRLEEYNDGRQRAGYRPIKIGIGINTGIVILGTIGGASRMDGTVIGDAVNLAARLERLTKEYRVSILISEYTLYCLDEPGLWSIRFLDRTYVRGKQDSQSVYEVFNADPAPLREAKKKTLKTFELALAYYHLDDILTSRERLIACLAIAPDDDAARVYLERCESPAGGLSSQRAELASSWREEYSFGQAAVDAAHKNLLADMNGLARAVNVGAWDLTPPLLAQIQFAAANDFMIEEEMMVADGYPFLDLHVRQHQRFFEYFGELRREIERGEENRVYLAFRVKRLLTDWLVNHILNADRHYGHYLHSRAKWAVD